MEHGLFLVKLMISAFISDVPDWIDTAQTGIKQYRMKKRLEKAFAFQEDEDAGLDLGILAGDFAAELKACVEQADIAKVLMEMELPPRERVAQHQRILSLQSILLRQLRVDEKGLPLQLDEAVKKETAQHSAREKAKSRMTLGLSSRSLHVSSDPQGDNEDEMFQSAAAAALREPALAEMSVCVVEAVRPHSFKTNATADDHFLYVTFAIKNEERAGAKARTSMCEARPNISFAPVSIQVYQFPAELKLELLSWAGDKRPPNKVATTSIFITCSPFDVDTTGEYQASRIPQQNIGIQSH